MFDNMTDVPAAAMVMGGRPHIPSSSMWMPRPTAPLSPHRPINATSASSRLDPCHPRDRHGRDRLGEQFGGADRLRQRPARGEPDSEQWCHPPFRRTGDLEAAPVGGTAPYTVTFTVNGQNFRPHQHAALHGGHRDPARGHLHGLRADGGRLRSPATGELRANVFSILPNPIVAAVTSPTNGQTIVAGQPLPLAATASVGLPLTITNVQFFVDGASVGNDATAPYTGSYPTPVSGAHRFHVVATDNLGRSRFFANEPGHGAGRRRDRRTIFSKTPFRSMARWSRRPAATWARTRIWVGSRRSSQGISAALRSGGRGWRGERCDDDRHHGQRFQHAPRRVHG
jgi:hypothetical protein